jgi:ubiquitin carboxyl-terminal hydrolase 5/13
MGFHLNAARRAVILSGNLGSEAATNWIMQHMDDANLNDPIEEPGTPGAGGAAAPFIADPEAVSNIQGMGFTAAQAVKALQATDNNVERAVDWIFSHMDELNSPEPTPQANPAQQAQAVPNCTDGHGSKLP